MPDILSMGPRGARRSEEAPRLHAVYLGSPQRSAAHCPSASSSPGRNTAGGVLLAACTHPRTSVSAAVKTKANLHKSILDCFDYFDPTTTQKKKKKTAEKVVLSKYNVQQWEGVTARGQWWAGAENLLPVMCVGGSGGGGAGPLLPTGMSSRL